MSAVDERVDSDLVALAGSTCMMCSAVATLLVWHGCGAPGGAVCEKCWQGHVEKMAAAMQLAARGDADVWCRHCQTDVDSSHVFVVPL